MAARMDPSQETIRLLWASRFPGIGKRRLAELVADKLFVRLEERELRKNYAGILAGGSEHDRPGASRFVDATLEELRVRGDMLLSPFDALYPDTLRFAPTLTPLLYVRGSVEALRRPVVGIIGTREPTVAGLEIARRVTEWFVQRHWTILSGLAIGIDTAAHEACLRAGGSTVAVLAHGLDQVHPKSNEKLAHDLVSAGGCLVTEYSYRTPPFKGNFVERDTLQANLSYGIFLVQSGETGGSLHASRAIVLAGRPLLVGAPSRTDVARAEPKIVANQILFSHDVRRVVGFLDVPPDRVARIVPVAGRAALPMAELAMIQAFEETRRLEESKRRPRSPS